MAGFAPGIGLSQNLRQEQTLSPQMLQSLALLPMPILELKAHIQQEIESNPALEIPEREFDDPSMQDTSTQPSSAQGEHMEQMEQMGGTFAGNGLDDRMDDADGSYYEGLTGDDIAGGQEYGDFPSGSSDPDSSDRFNSMLENAPSKGQTLQEHLLEQLGEVNIPNSVRKAGEMLISDLDANGFYILSPQKLFETSCYSQNEIDEAIQTIQGFDPNGVCTKDFRESLVLQAKLSGMALEDLETFKELVNTQLEKIKAGKNKEAAQALGITEQDLETFVAILKTFTPYPGRNFDSNEEVYIEPDFSIHNDNGTLQLELNRRGIPSLEVSPDFESLANGLKGPEAKEASKYIGSCVKQANILIDQVNLRFRTLYNAAAAIMDIQREFFLHGPRHLKTMTLRDVAERIGVHETTMSRLAQSKWVDTDWGMFQLKYFFTQGVSSSQPGNETVSRNVVKDMIREIVQENGALSDQKISDLLMQKGVKCARRTVGKYRAELNIDSSYERS